MVNNKKCIIITTINKPNEIINYYSKLLNWDLIIVGDSKTDDKLYQNIKCIYLGLTEQNNMFPSLFDKIPLKSYTRKMFGYLYAIKKKYLVIYDTDDDNKYIGDLDLYNVNSSIQLITKQEGFINVYKLYTREYIWPRGIPPNHKCIDLIPYTIDNKNVENNINKNNKQKFSVIQGLVNNDPDVDAYYRININNKSFNFDDIDKDITLGKYSIFPINTQNTFWQDPDMFYAMYLPVSVTFRYTDILRGFIALFQIWKNNKNIKITKATAFQDRNIHDLTKDYESELSMYETAEKVIELLNNNKNATMSEIYYILAENKIVSYNEINILNEWNNLIAIYK